MGYALKIYEAFREYGEEKARILAEAFEELEKRYPQILDMATKKDLTETELKLTKEIEQVRKEMKEMELRLQGEIEQVRLEVEEVRLEVEQVRKEMKELELRLQGEIERVRKEMKEVELRLQKEIEQVRLEVEQVRREISETKASLVKWMFLFWTGQIIAFAGLLKLMLP